MTKVEEIQDRLDAASATIIQIIQAVTQESPAESAQVTRADSGAESPLRADLGSRRIAVNPSLIVKEVPEYDPS